ncbi:MAG: TIGR00296 family protein [Candidatus Thorarchaeota archaeon]
MSKLLTLEEGTILTRFARQSIESYITNKQILELPDTTSKALLENRGVFVTLKKYQSGNQKDSTLRGCIGRLQPSSNSHQNSIPLLEATRQAALSSAFEDPRFPPVRDEELNSILVEVSVLTIPEELQIKDRTKLHDQITIGKHGLIIEGKGWHKGLLLPQVAPEQEWNAEEFLQGCCQKAGMASDCYLNTENRILTFEAQIFAETSIRGKIIERKF